jgi:hypothetical protein
MSEQQAPAEEIRRGTRFRAFPGRQTFIDGEWRTGVTYRVTAVRRYVTNSPEVYWRLDDAGTKAQSHASLNYLIKNGLEILP